MDDAGPGRHDAQVTERGLRPAQQLVALAVPLVLALDVERERPVVAEHVDLDRVVDDEVGRDERVDERRVAAEVGHGVAHDREIDDRGHAVKSWRITREGMNGISASAVAPGRHAASVSTSSPRTIPPPAWRSRFSRRIFSVTGARHVQPVADGVQPEVRVAVVTDLQRGAGAKGIDRGLPGCHRARLLRQPRSARAKSAPDGCARPGSRSRASIAAARLDPHATVRRPARRRPRARRETCRRGGPQARRGRRETAAALEAAGIELDPTPPGTHRHGDLVHPSDHTHPHVHAEAGQPPVTGIVGAGAVGRR